MEGDTWLADVGFGAHSHYPLAYAERGEQDDPGGAFRVVEAGPDVAGVRGGGSVGAGAWDLDVVRNGKPQYRLVLGTDEEVLAVYRERFGIALDRVPTVRNQNLSP